LAIGERSQKDGGQDAGQHCGGNPARWVDGVVSDFEVTEQMLKVLY